MHPPTNTPGVELARANLDIWISHDQAKRIEMSKETYHSDIVIYVRDKVTTGLEAMEETIDRFLASVGGAFEMRVIEPVAEAHDLVVLNWEMVKEGRVVLKGADINLIEDAKIKKCWVIFK